MSSWALHSTATNKKYPSGGFSMPMTLNVYGKPAAATPTRPGELLGGVTQAVIVPCRPEADPTCTINGNPAPTAWRASDNQCYNGMAFNVTFNLSSLGVTLPNDVIVDVAYNTQTWGPEPRGTDGPYNSINVGVIGTPSTGTDNSDDEVFWNTDTAGQYADNGGTDPADTFRRDTGWGAQAGPPAVPAEGTLPIKITATS